VSLLLIASRGAETAALAGLFGGALYTLFVAPAPGDARAFALAASALALAGSAAWAGAALLALADRIDAETAAAFLSTGFGRLFVLRIGLTALLVAAAWRGGPISIAALAGLLLATQAGLGHAAAAPAAWRPARLALQAAHALAAGAWLGAIPPFIAALAGGEGARAAAARFPRIGYPAAALVFASGLAIAASMLPSLAALASAQYGRILTLKAGLALAMLALAAINRLRLSPALAHDDPAARRALTRVAASELALGAAIVLLAATLSQTAPP
jgi:putative copper export protein